MKLAITPVPLAMTSSATKEVFVTTGAHTAEFSGLAAVAGAEFSLRACYAMISARWLNLSTEPGVLTGFGIAAVLLALSLFVATGVSNYSFGWMLGARAFRWSVVYLMFAGCSLFWSSASSTSSSALYWLGLVSDAAIIVLLCRGIGVETAAYSVMKGFVAATCALAATAWIMPPEADLRLGDLEYFNTNQIGNLCALALLMCSLLTCRGKRCWRGTSLFLGVTLCRSLSKATLVAFLVCQGYRLVQDPTMGRKRKSVLILVAAVIFLAFLGLWEAYFDIYSTAGNQAETLTGRTAIWAWSLSSGLSHPWFGNGFDAMWKVAPPFGSDLFEARHAENEILQQFFAYGVCGIAQLAGIYISLYRQFRAIRERSLQIVSNCFLIFVLVRGLAEAEPFDLLLPLWLLTLLSFIAQVEMKRQASEGGLGRLPEALERL
jgi:O-antigen ligase